MSSLSLMIMTGAGISAESGIQTFRGAVAANKGKLWKDYDYNDVATPEAFKNHPERVHEFYNMRRAQLVDRDIQPHDGHFALARLQNEYIGDVHFFTQNVDDLHERAGARNVKHVHGSLAHIRCTKCGSVVECFESISADTYCTKCGFQNCMRPDIVWFGENVRHVDEMLQTARTCDILIVVGTSGAVAPANQVARFASLNNATVYFVNLETSYAISGHAQERLGKASVEVPKLVDELLS